MSSLASHLKLVPDHSKKTNDKPIQKRSLGRVLLAQNWVTESDLLKAWSIQAYEQAAIGEILIGMGKITQDQLYWALGELHDLDIVDFAIHPPSLNWVDFSTPIQSLQKGYIVWRCTDTHMTIAVTDPNMIENLRAEFHDKDKLLDFVLITPPELQKFIAGTQADILKDNALSCCPDAYSCKSWMTWSKPNILRFGLLSVLVTIAVINPATTIFICLCIVFATLTVLMWFRLFCLYTLYSRKNNKHAKPNKRMKRPKVSILVPLYKESAIINRLINRLSSIEYPKELLEIHLIYEQNDDETKNAITILNQPDHIKFLEVPDGHLKTKPRAMNYALDFCTGSIIGIYDAEDAPEINQVECVIQHLNAADDDVACVQCVLDFYNPKTNWMSRCFTIEYAILFRVILPALSKYKLPIPLGGTSVFFRRNILEKMGRWDAYNVTEDADLGYRLYRMGYRCEWINAITYEEANYRFIPWIKQRSRWLKGLLFTGLVHLRNPIKLHQKIGTLAFMSMVSLTIIPWLLCPLVPIILPMWVLSIGYDLPYYSNLPPYFITGLVGLFIATECLSFVLGFTATNTPNHKHLRPWIFTTILYWPITCFASYKALFEMIIRPSYWDKSEHGLNDQLYEKEIEKLTQNSAQFPINKN
ncbi:glycosyltransferase [Amylibacter sp. SFDW26]|uniref:glycosyltransferase family 2 protein n=1 Tax=Amylibacter sp. SFDW26 TaxID=2652722 RepID=UPI00126198FF|nr:glycosyltransferase family 2 protein [Amylibacter sp. SFDW26]KAB7615538.1 glycosyltransferase [Amylibacter sp. SFDW26]